MKYSIKSVKKELEKNPTKPIIYFWGHTPNPKKITTACLSQWYDCTFKAEILRSQEKVVFHTAEQFMMASKALLFDDMETYGKIMNESNPSAYKKLGRLVKNFDPKRWDEVKFDIVVEGNNEVIEYTNNYEKIFEDLINNGYSKKDAIK